MFKPVLSVLLLVALISSSFAFAQDTTTFEDDAINFTFDYPADWELAETDTELNSVTIANSAEAARNYVEQDAAGLEDGMAIIATGYFSLAIFGVAEVADVTTFIVEDLTEVLTEPSPITVEEQEGLFLSGIDEDGLEVAYYLFQDESQFSVIAISAPVGETAQHEPVVEIIIATFESQIDVVDGQVTFDDVRFGFTFAHPADWGLVSADETLITFATTFDVGDRTAENIMDDLSSGEVVTNVSLLTLREGDTFDDLVTVIVDNLSVGEVTSERTTFEDTELVTEYVFADVGTGSELLLAFLDTGTDLVVNIQLITARGDASLYVEEVLALFESFAFRAE